ncbi:MAG: ATP-binding cassette domain-containing protein [Pseudomonadota bacterium]
MMRLERFTGRRADALSGGMYKKLALACALLHRPRVLVLDEPTNGVDPVSRRELWDLLHELVAEGMAVVLATPYMDEAAACHRVGLLYKGKMLTEGHPAALVGGFVHDTLLVRAPNRRHEIETLIEGREEVLAVSPQGMALRVVVRHDAAAAFRRFAKDEVSPSLELEPITPSFEDVFLTLMAEKQASSHGSAQWGEQA